MNKLLVYTMAGPTDPTKAGIAFAYAAAAKKEGLDVVLFLFHDAVLLARKELAEMVVPVGPPPISDSIASLLESNAKIFVCSACYEKRGLAKDQLMKNAELQGIGKFVELSKESKLVPF